jgi:hypothetical protein
VLAGILIGAAPSRKSVDTSTGFVESSLALLARADSKALAASHHYPDSYTADERAKDVSDVEKSLNFLFESFGKPQNLRPTHERVTFYEMGAGGGTVPYWASLSPLAEQTLTYTAQFPNLGPGYVVLSVVRVQGGSPELRAISFGLPLSSPTAKSTILNLTADLMKQMGISVSDEVRKALVEQLQPTIAPPASIE